MIDIQVHLTTFDLGSLFCAIVFILVIKMWFKLR